MLKNLSPLTLILAVFAVAPLWLMPFDFWDGRVIDYALSTGDLRGLKVWFLQSRWDLQYGECVIIHSLETVTGISHRLWFAFIASLAIIGIAYETYRYARDVFRLPRFYALFACYLALFFPAWHTLAASVLLLHALCTWWLLSGVRLSKKTSKTSQWLGIVLIVASFQLNSDISVLVGLCVVECILEFFANRHVSPATWRRCGMLTGLAVGVFFIMKTFFKPYGLFEGYNHITAFESITNVWECLRLFARYAIWPTVVLGLVAIGFMLAILERCICHQPLLPWRGIFYALATHYPHILALTLLFFAATTPYVLVLKYAKFVEFYDWSHRNAFPLCMPLCVMGGFLASLLTTDFRSARIIATVCIGAYAVLLYMGYSQKMERSAFERGVIEALKIGTEPPSGAVFMQYDKMGKGTIRGYESNWLLWRAYGQLRWISKIDASGSARTIEPEAEVKTVMEGDDEALRLQYLLPVFHHPSCFTNIHLTGKRLTQLQSWAWIVGLHADPVIGAKYETECLP